ncbi:MAG: hypothetical protein PVH19_05420 [Planctomycetia bacterium]|jgi:hypothetical protein
MLLRNTHLLVATMVIFVFSPSSIMALNTKYTFDKIADTSGSFQWLSLSNLNNSGVVCFSTELSENEYAVYTGNREGLTEIVHTGDTFDNGVFEIVNRGKVNDDGTVVFTSFRYAPNWSGVTGVFLHKDTTTTRIATDGSVDTEINNEGLVAYTASPSSYNNLYVYDGSSTSTLVYGGEIHGTISFPDMNDYGTVAFSATSGRIFIADATSLTKIVDIDESELYALNGSVINNAGTVIFSGWLDGGGSGLYEYKNGHLNQLINTLDTALLTIGTPAINDRGEIAFAGKLDNGQKGLFVGFDLTQEPILLTGDQLDEQTIEDISFFRNLNNAGQLAFSVQYANGQSAIYIATPVPEPGMFTLLLVLISAIVMPGLMMAWKNWAQESKLR